LPNQEQEEHGMLVLVCYDVNTETKEGRRRLSRVARACKDFGYRVQKSIFECLVAEADWVRLKHRLLSEYDQKSDSLLFYFLDEEARRKKQHHGIGAPVDPEGPLVV
jgi:CRISPR-associated protein Cas2